MVVGAWYFRGGRAEEAVARMWAVGIGALDLMGRRVDTLAALDGVAVGFGAGVLSGGRAVVGVARLG